jgi:hypothetical protein
MINIKDTILSQYANSPTLLALINSMNDAIDPGVNIDDFYNKIWDITTAQGFGLDVWGRIVGVSRILNVASGKSLGYKEGGTIDYDPFGQSKFFSGSITTSNFALSDNAFRVLILVKALSNISRTVIPVYNKILMQLFPGRGNAYVSDTGSMGARLTFEFLLLPFEIAILKQSGAFFNPTGVQFFIMDISIPHTFGFSEAGYSAAGFNQGIYFKGYE